MLTDCEKQATISIRALRGEGDNIAEIVYTTDFISIRALRGEGDLRASYSYA